MCGIAGILKVWTPAERDLALRTPHGQSIPESWLDILDDSIKHRGPDGHGRFRDRAIRADGCVVDVALVHRRLSIIDHAGGHQPMVHLRGTGILPVSDVQRYTSRVMSTDWAEPAARPESSHGQDARATDLIAVVFNGCIYNHRELRAELQRAGHVFSTDHSDTEVLVHGWREWGDRLLERLDGMFALVVWDSARGEIVLARDTFGEKPLYHSGHSKSGGTLAFGSTAASVARLHLIDATDENAWSSIAPWIKFGWNQGMMPTTGVSEIVAGFSEAHPSRPHSNQEKWAGPAYPMSWIDEVLNPTNAPVSIDECDRLIRDAVCSRLDADVPIGCFLSGGLDSALIAAIARESRPDVQAFTVRMPTATHDESALAQATARHLGLRHMVLDCEPDPCADLSRIIEQVGLPFGDSSLLPSAWVSRAARQHLGVALSGDGGDEMFLGYERHCVIRWLARLRRLSPELLSAAANALPIGAGDRRSARDRLSRLVNAANGDGYKELVAIFPSPLDEQLGVHEVGPGMTGKHWGMTRAGDDAALTSILALRFDRMFYLPCDLMRKSDTASMSVALEVRAPMLQHDLARAAMNAPISSLMPHNQRKGLLRQVARKYLPAEIVDRPKMGFAIPIGEWFRSDYGGLRTMLLDHLNSTEPFGPPSLGIDLNMTFIRQMLDEHLGTGPSGMVKRDHSQRLYMLLVLSIWAKWMGGLR